MSTFDFDDGNGPVAAHRHVNPDGSIGGWVADSAVVGNGVYIGPDARVSGISVILGEVQLSGRARVEGHGAWLCDRIKLTGSAIVRGHVMLGGDTFIGGTARIEEVPQTGTNLFQRLARRFGI